MTFGGIASLRRRIEGKKDKVVEVLKVRKSPLTRGGLSSTVDCTTTIGVIVMTELIEEGRITWWCRYPPEPNHGYFEIAGGDKK